MIRLTLDSVKSAFLFIGGMAIGMTVANILIYLVLHHQQDKPKQDKPKIDNTHSLFYEWMLNDYDTRTVRDTFAFASGFNFAARLVNNSNMFMTIDIRNENMWTTTMITSNTVVNRIHTKQ